MLTAMGSSVAVAVGARVAVGVVVGFAEGVAGVQAASIKITRIHERRVRCGFSIGSIIPETKKKTLAGHF
jgi:hypothetical protein